MATQIPSIEVVSAKFREAVYHCDQLAITSKVHEFYANLNAFLSAARSVLYVARHEFGWEERRKDQRVHIASEENKRNEFDVWYKNSPIVKAVLSHPLAEQRHEVVHRSGQAGFLHTPKPIDGEVGQSGTALRPNLWWGMPGLGGMPLRDENIFYFEAADGSRVEAFSVCREYLELVHRFLIELKDESWVPRNAPT